MIVDNRKFDWEKFAVALETKFNGSLLNVGIEELVSYMKEYIETEPVENLTKSRYSEKIPDARNHSGVFAAVDWDGALDNGSIMDDDGIGYWAKDGLMSYDCAFRTPKLDATHVVWFNK